MTPLSSALKQYADAVRWNIGHWIDGLPSVTVLCPTFGRPYLLNEAVESFLRQDYEGELKMLILNDQPELKIFSDIENIIVMNKAKRYPTLAEKRKALLKMGDTDVCMLYGDDDILMPWAVSAALSGMVSHFTFMPHGHVRYNQQKDLALYLPKAPLAGPIVFSNRLMQRAEVEQSHNPPGFEVQLIYGLKKYIPKGFSPLVSSGYMPPDKVYYMVRTHLDNHMSVNQKGYRECGEFVKGLDLNGDFKLIPGWDRDYEQTFKDVIARKTQ